MQSKTTTSHQTTQHLIAGLLQNDSNIEFFGLPETMEVEFMQNGRSHSFKDLDKETFRHLANAQNSNKEYQAYIDDYEMKVGARLPYGRKVEIYTYFMYGGCDTKPDVLAGKLQEPENYRHASECPSLNFKTIKLNGSPLKIREVKMLDLMCDVEDFTDEVIAGELNITRSTLNIHKKTMFNKTGTKTKAGLIMAAVRQKIPRFNNPARV